MSFKYVNDLSILELVLFGSLLSEFDFRDQVASDVGIDEQFVAAFCLSTQENLNRIPDWTKTNEMKLNEQKFNYMIYDTRPLNLLICEHLCCQNPNHNLNTTQDNLNCSWV